MAASSDVFDEVAHIEEMTEQAIVAVGGGLNKNGCIVVANTYPSGVDIAKRANLPCVFVDTLFWMWNRLPISLDDVERYYIEDFHCIGASAHRFGSSTKFKMVAPLVDTNVLPKAVPHPFLLVSLGGIDSNLYDFPVFYERLIAYISAEKKLERYHILICGGGKKFMQREFARFEHSRLTIDSLPPREHIAYLKSADMVLASAGLHGFYENYFLRKNVMFLPPQSYSQYLQLKAVLREYPGVIGANFEELGVAHVLRENMPDVERINEVKRTNRQLVEDQTMGKFIALFEEFCSGQSYTLWTDGNLRPTEDQCGPATLAQDLLLNVDQQMVPPQLPNCCPPVSTDGMSLRDIRDRMAKLEQSAPVREQLLSLVEDWRSQPRSVEPLSTVRLLLDSIRALPRGDERLIRMNTFVRTLGEPETFATFLDMIRDSSRRDGTVEQALSEISHRSSKHAVYGWCGQTRLVLSGAERTEGTVTPRPGVERFLGKTPTSAWALSMHIWQPNVRAKGFLCGRSPHPSSIVEPPHSHPFDFASVVVIGTMHQSIYAQRDSVHRLLNDPMADRADRYSGVKLVHVHGVWPPHFGREEVEVQTIEDRLKLTAGDSYYMSANTIHDVQFDEHIAQNNPAITLFLRSESFVEPHVYMASSMADFHASNPDLKHQGRALTEVAWDQKLRMVADYVRGINKGLNLGHIVKYDNDYAFFHR